MKVPVLLTIFNRADAALAAFQSIKTYMPERLYIAADGPREHKVGEKLQCEQARKAVLEAIDWSCEIHTLLREENLGCANAMYGAISWFLQQEEWGIICEDDIVLSQDFYKLCEVLLPKYKDEKQIQQIAAFNPTAKSKQSNSFAFTKRPNIWGWATWRRSWQEYMDMSMSRFPNLKMLSLVKYYGLLQSVYMYRTWRKTYRNIETCTSWATRWHFASIANDLVCVCPVVNLSLNIGCDTGGTHYSKGDEDPYSHVELGELTFPLKYPTSVELSQHQLALDIHEFWRVRRIGMKKILRKWMLA